VAAGVLARRSLDARAETRCTVSRQEKIMSRSVALALALALGLAGAAAALRPATAQDAKKPEAAVDSLYALATTTLEGKEIALSEFKGKVTLCVNVASQCGFTPQYKGLQALHDELKDKGFAVLGFPSNEFGGQEPGSPEQIRKFCDSNYSVKFPLFSKVVTKPGSGQSPVYKFLTDGRDAPSWNFCKYLVGKDGKVLHFYPSKVKPDDAELRKAIEAALK
jgi:glutathione peroxidase